MFEKPTLTIIGFGAFGALAAASLAPHLRVIVHDPSPQARDAALAAGFDVLDDLARIEGEFILLAVPVPALEGCLTRLAPHLRPGQVVIDTCSIKEEPARLMRHLLPPGVDGLPTHPMFGPNSAARGLRGLRIVLCPQGGKWRRIAAFLRARLGLQVILASPEDHDRQAAVGQGLVHLLAHAFDAVGAPAIRTSSFDLLADAFAMVRSDPPEVFSAVTRGNRHMADARERLIRAIADLSSVPLRP